MQQYIWFPYNTRVYVEHFNTPVIDLRDEKGMVIQRELSPAIKNKKAADGRSAFHQDSSPQQQRDGDTVFDGAKLYDSLGFDDSSNTMERFPSPKSPSEWYASPSGLKGKSKQSGPQRAGSNDQIVDECGGSNDEKAIEEAEEMVPLDATFVPGGRTAPPPNSIVRLAFGEAVVVGEGADERGTATRGGQNTNAAANVSDEKGKVLNEKNNSNNNNNNDSDETSGGEENRLEEANRSLKGGISGIYEPTVSSRVDPKSKQQQTTATLLNLLGKEASTTAYPHLPTSEATPSRDRSAGAILSSGQRDLKGIQEGGAGNSSVNSDNEHNKVHDAEAYEEEEERKRHALTITARQALRHILYSTIRDSVLRNVLDGCLLPPPLAHPDLRDPDGTRPYTRAEVVAAARSIPREMVPTLVNVPLNFALATGVYDARLRAAVKRLAHLLDYPIEGILVKEEMLSHVDMSDLAKEEAKAAQEKIEKKRKKIPIRRYAAIGAFSVLGAAALVVTGGLAAPIVAPALTAVVGALVTTVGAAGAIGTALIGGTAAAVVFGALVGVVSHAAALTVLITPILTTANLTAIFGISGAGLAAYKAKKRLGALDDFRIRSIDDVERHDAFELIAQHYTAEGLERLVAESKKLDKEGKHSIEDDVTRRSYQGIIVPVHVRSIALTNLAASPRFKTRRRVHVCGVESRLPPELSLELAALKLTVGVWAHAPPHRIDSEKAGLFLCHNRPKYPTGAHGYVCYRVVITESPVAGSTSPSAFRRRSMSVSAMGASTDSAKDANKAAESSSSAPPCTLTSAEKAILKASIWISTGIDFSGKERLGCTIRLANDCPLSRATSLKRKKAPSKKDLVGGGEEKGSLFGNAKKKDFGGGSADSDECASPLTPAEPAALLADEEGHTADDDLRELIDELEAIAALEDDFVKRVGPLEIEGRLKPKPHVVVRLLPTMFGQDGANNDRAATSYFHEREITQQTADSFNLADKHGTRTLLGVIKNSMTDPNNDRSYLSPSAHYGQLQLVTVRTLNGGPTPRFSPPAFLPLRHACVIPFTNNNAVLPSGVEFEVVFMGEAPLKPSTPQQHSEKTKDGGGGHGNSTTTPTSANLLTPIGALSGGLHTANASTSNFGGLSESSSLSLSHPALEAFGAASGQLSSASAAPSSTRSFGMPKAPSSQVFFVTVRAKISTTKTLSGTATVLETLPPRRSSGAKDELGAKMKEKPHECAHASPYARVVVSFDEAASAVIFEVKDPLPVEYRNVDTDNSEVDKAEAEKKKGGITNKRCMTITVAATGYITIFDPRVPSKDQQVAVWQPTLTNSPFFSNSQQFVVEWENEHQQNLFGVVGLDAEHTAVSAAQNKATKLVVGKAKKRLMQGAVFAVFSSYTALWGTLELPLYAVWAGDAIDNSFASLRARAKLAGRELAAALLSSERGNRPVTLTGYSFGANVMFECLLALFEANALYVVEDVFLLGACLETDREKWRKARQACGGRLVNVYNRSDWHLWIFHRLNTLGSRPLAGMCPISLPGVENIDVSAVITAHGDYALHLTKAFEHIPPTPTTETCRINTGGSAMGARVPAADILNAADRVLDAMSTSLAVMLDLGFVLSYTNRLVVDASTDYSSLWAVHQQEKERISRRHSNSSGGMSSEAMSIAEEAQSLSGDVSLVFIGEVCYGCQFDFSPPAVIDTCEAGVAGLLCPMMSRSPCCVAGFAVHMGALSDTILVILVFMVFDTSPLKHEVKGACKGLVVPARERPDEDAAQLGRRLRRIVEHYASDPRAVSAFATSTNSFTTIVDIPISPLPDVFSAVAQYATPNSSSLSTGLSTAETPLPSSPISRADNNDTPPGAATTSSRDNELDATRNSACAVDPPMTRQSTMAPTIAVASSYSSGSLARTPTPLDSTVSPVKALRLEDGDSSGMQRPLAAMADAVGMDLEKLLSRTRNDGKQRLEEGEVKAQNKESQSNPLAGDASCASAAQGTASTTEGNGGREGEALEVIHPLSPDPHASKNESMNELPATCPVKIAWTWRDNHFTLAVSGILSRHMEDLLTPGDGEEDDEDLGGGPDDLLDPLHIAALRLEAPPIGKYLDAEAVGSCATLLPLESMHAGVVQLRRALCSPPSDVLDTEDDSIIAMVFIELGNAVHRSCGFTVNGALLPLATLSSTCTTAATTEQEVGDSNNSGNNASTLLQPPGIGLGLQSIDPSGNSNPPSSASRTIRQLTSHDSSFSLTRRRADLFEATLAAIQRRTVVVLQPVVIANCSNNNAPLCLPEDSLSLLSAAEGFQWLRTPPPLIGPSQCTMLAFRWRVDPYSVFKAEADRVMNRGGGSGGAGGRKPITKCQVLLSSFSLVDLPQDGQSSGRSTYVIRIIATLTCEDIINKPMVTTRIGVSCLVDTTDDRHRQSVVCFTKGLAEEEVKPTEGGEKAAVVDADGSTSAPYVKPTRYEAVQYPCLMIPAGGAVPLHVSAQRDAPDKELDWLFLDKAADTEDTS